MPKCTKSLAQTRRDKLIDRVERRGRRTANIWLLKQPLTGRDLVLVGDIRMEHFFFMEGDPAVDRVEYEPSSVDTAEASISFDCVVDYRDGHRECHQVRHAPLQENSPAQKHGAAAAKRLGGTHVVVTTKDLDSQRQRIHNWQRAIAALNRCNRRPLELIELEILTYVESDRSTTIGQLCEALERDPALVVAATVRLLRKRTLSSDMDQKPWSRHTRIVREDAA